MSKILSDNRVPVRILTIMTGGTYKFFYYFIIFIANLDPALETFLGVTLRDVDRGLRRGTVPLPAIRVGCNSPFFSLLLASLPSAGAPSAL